MGQGSRTSKIVKKSRVWAKHGNRKHRQEIARKFDEMRRRSRRRIEDPRETVEELLHKK